MVLLELSVVPLGAGESVSQHVAECVALIEQSGLEYELNAMGTIVEGELDQVLAIIDRCMRHLAKSHDRVTCSAKLDYRKGRSGRIRAKVDSVREKLA
ncbi:hypothetical protein Pla175_46760 [Pirellulimonas nuda]|uniref:Thiamine-binding protein domain-containing protein n=1 Tax=Pirellulimonas nuda TaxID=2528009 RepID=A0A518DIF7_9BACT|nr:MTH1187 family thiamine-binding protein [Pirellulimonas nuda]QDU91256.1 hypothetical protein Pla175_46760 [Pirellulimonas nuda]